MRILMINVIDWAGATGGASHQLGLIRAWTAMGHEVRVVSPGHGPNKLEGTLPRCEFLNSVSLRRLGLPPSLDTLPQLASLVALSRRFKPDFVYTRVNMLTPLIVALGRALGLMVVLEHNSWMAKERLLAGGSAWLARFENWAQVAAAKRAFASRCVTRGLAAHLEGLGVPKEKLHFIGNGTDVDRLVAVDRSAALAEFGLPPERTYAGFIGNIMAWHGLDVAVEAFAQVAGRLRDMDFIIFGDGPPRADLIRLAQARGVGDRVRFMGFVPLASAGAAISCFDIAVLPLTNANDVAFGFSSIKLRDYAAAGRLVLTGHVPDNTDHLGQGWLFTHRADDADDMARMLLIVHDKTKDRDEISRAARRYAEEHFSWDAIARRILAIVEGPRQG
ncbi:MAG TPA: glycosyltransferase family 4 protein [Hyphomicrobiaceae bacterium]|nr:glycosyltransferase family 4 protein [Hyphomicrobiaceae bacterium]